MNILSKIFSNTHKPEGFFGRMMVNGMNGGGHAKMAEWGLSVPQPKVLPFFNVEKSTKGEKQRGSG